MAVRVDIRLPANVERHGGSFRGALDAGLAPLGRALRLPHLLVGGALVASLCLAALLAPALAPAAPDAIAPGMRLSPPSLAHPLGTDQLGRDLLSRVLYGARTALMLAVPAVLLGSIPGISLGLLAGYRGGTLDQILSRVMEAWLAFPGLLLAIVLVARLGPSLGTTVLALGIVGIPTYYRLTRAGTLSARRSLYVEAACALGLRDTRVVLRHILPNLASPLVVLVTLRLGTVILAGGALGFIGLGAQPPTPEWGSMLAAGRDSMGRGWWLAFFPGLAITASVMGFNLFGDGLRDALAPDLGQRCAATGRPSTSERSEP